MKLPCNFDIIGKSKTEIAENCKANRILWHGGGSQCCVRSADVHTQRARVDDDEQHDLGFSVCFHSFIYGVFVWLLDSTSSTQAIATIGFTESDSFLCIFVVIVIVCFCLHSFFYIYIYYLRSLFLICSFSCNSQCVVWPNEYTEYRASPDQFNLIYSSHSFAAFLIFRRFVCLVQAIWAVL